MPFASLCCTWPLFRLLDIPMDSARKRVANAVLPPSKVRESQFVEWPWDFFFFSPVSLRDSVCVAWILSISSHKKQLQGKCTGLDSLYNVRASRCSKKKGGWGVSALRHFSVHALGAYTYGGQDRPGLAKSPLLPLFYLLVPFFSRRSPWRCSGLDIKNQRTHKTVFLIPSISVLW